MTDRAVVILPTYNEKENLEFLIREILTVSPAVDVAVVDDQSPDGTGAVAEKLSLESPRVHVLHRTGPRGRGLAGVEGFTWALEKNYDVVLEMDADFSHSTSDIPRFLEAIKTADVIIGSRFVPGGNDMRKSRFRNFFSKMTNFFLRRLLRSSVRDCTSGFRCFHRSALEAIDLKTFVSQGPSIVEEVLYRVSQRHLRIEEIPIKFQDRRKGRSKLNFGKAFGALLTLPKIRSHKIIL